ncbi:hypothetical protein O3G_MSEX015165 [Manduca sexta]|uniref:Uncharacterized protein n=1 Tax=Manduca sexta TaxID=7130 RepID=A0A922D1N7_MANSE|nr:hypothetical protein O3G_MSEX015165 [Manduca sexta]KAG6465456.1 hypothetical protein O3G_MSEX015165 [Manduca sexta]KAG6465457.1 hypothetical protein O3G_MSEX015165 [Manduca sexta]
MSVTSTQALLCACVKKDKLTFDAVPTLDGPFCDPGQYADTTTSQDEAKIYPISLYDIETEYLTLYEKKANFSVKYGDFLTNCDLMDMGSFNHVNSSKTLTSHKGKHKRGKKIKESHGINLNDNVNKLPDSTTINILQNKSSSINEDTQTQLEGLIPAGYSFIQPNILEYDGLNSNLNNQCEKNSKNINNDETKAIQKDSNVSNPMKKDLPRESRVKILSEKKISEPVPIAGKLEPVSPSLILRLPDKRNKKKTPEDLTNTTKKDEIKATYTKILNNSNEMLSIKEVPVTKIKEKDENKAGFTNILNSNTEYISSSKEVPAIKMKEEGENHAGYTKILYNNAENVSSSKEIIVINTRKKDENKGEFSNNLNNNTENVSSTKEGTVPNYQQQSSNHCLQENEKNNETNGISSKKSLLKPKINEVRMAAIKEKRKFNMKLRDIIESCLDKMDDQESGQTENSTIKNEQVSTFLSKDPALPNMQDYTLAFLEARIKRMEEVLLNKIDQNTQRIVELKNSVLTSAKKSAFTQTTHNEDSHKKQLYKEISKYLSQNASCLIYEELFLNKYAQSSSQNSPSPKRRKRR